MVEQHGFLGIRVAAAVRLCWFGCVGALRSFPCSSRWRCVLVSVLPEPQRCRAARFCCRRLFASANVRIVFVCVRAAVVGGFRSSGRERCLGSRQCCWRSGCSRAFVASAVILAARCFAGWLLLRSDLLCVPLFLPRKRVALRDGRMRLSASVGGLAALGQWCPVPASAKLLMIIIVIT